MTAKTRWRIYYILIAVLVLGVFAAYQRPDAVRTEPVTAGIGQGPPVGIPINPPKFQVRGGSNGVRYIVEVAYLDTAPVKVLAFIVNDRAGGEGCDTDIPGEMRPICSGGVDLPFGTDANRAQTGRTKFVGKSGLNSCTTRRVDPQRRTSGSIRGN